MDCRILSQSQLPHTSKLIRDYTENFSNLQSFFPHPPSLPSALEYAKSLHFTPEHLRTVASILHAQNLAFGCGPETLANLQKLESGAVALVSGQQVGLFGGPAYAFYKALSAIQAAKEVSAAGVSAVPVFWMATEDHDVDEVRRATLLHESSLHHFELPTPAREAIPVGRINLGAEILELVDRAAGMLSGPDADWLAQVLRESYTPQDTYGSAFGKLFARLFRKWGLILLDPLDEKLHRVAGPVLRDALLQRDEVNELLLQRGRELERAGYPAQVKVTNRSTVLFSMEDGRREAISASNRHFTVAGKSIGREELLKCLNEHPEFFSPNALFRPVVQDFLLPTAAYFAGPAEIAYYAQSQVVYQKLLGRMPVVMPRADFTLLDPKGDRILKKYGLQVEDVWLGSESLRKTMYGANIPEELAIEFSSALTSMEDSSAKLQNAIQTADPTMKEAVNRAAKRIRFQLEKLRAKSGAALDRHEKIVARHQEFLESLLHPQKNLQSRSLCFLPFLARWGFFGLEELQTLSSFENAGRHLIVPIP
jgi:bacillithiol biosynthesis cysteine-adding enzyme BshC